MTSASRVTLHNENGTLVIPAKDICPKMQPDYPLGCVLIYYYPEGDCDTIHWPRPKRDQLAFALFDLRECGVIPLRAEVYLPDGTLVDD